MGSKEGLHINFMVTRFSEKNIDAEKLRFDTNAKAKFPKVESVEKHVTINKDGEFIRCQVQDNKKLKKICKVRKSDKEKITALENAFENKYGKSPEEKRAQITKSTSPEVKRAGIKQTRTRRDKEVG